MVFIFLIVDILVFTEEIIYDFVEIGNKVFIMVSLILTPKLLLHLIYHFAQNWTSTQNARLRLNSSVFLPRVLRQIDSTKSRLCYIPIFLANTPASIFLRKNQIELTVQVANTSSHAFITGNDILIFVKTSSKISIKIWEKTQS